MSDTLKIPNRLYNFPEAYDLLSEMLNDSLGDFTPEVQAYFDALEGSLEEKTANTIRLFYEKLAYAEAKEKAARHDLFVCESLAKSATNLLKYLGDHIYACGKTEVETAVGIVQIDDSDGSPKTSVVPLNHADRVVIDPDGVLEYEFQARIAAYKDREIVIAARETEIDRLTDDQKVDKDFVKAQKTEICDKMGELKMQKARAGLWMISRCKNGQPSTDLLGTVNVEGVREAIEEYIPGDFLRYPPAPCPVVSSEVAKARWEEADKPDELLVWEAPKELFTELQQCGKVEEGAETVKIVIKRGYHIRTK